MALTVAQKALQAPGPEALGVLLLKPRDADGNEVLVAVSNAPFDTLPGDAVASESFAPLIARGDGLVLGSFLTQPGQVIGQSEITQDTVAVEPSDTARALWPTLFWNGATAEWWVGARHRADGQRMSFSEFDREFRGVVEDARPSRGTQWEIEFADRRKSLEEVVSPKFYRGFGGGFAIRAGEDLSGPGNAGVNIGPPFTFELIGRLQALPAGVSTLMGVKWQTGVGLARSAAIQMKPTGELTMFLDTGGSVTALDSGELIDGGDPFYAAITLESDGVTARLYAGTDADDVLPVVETTLVTVMTSNPWTNFRLGGLSGPRFDAWEARLWSVAKSQSELEELGDGPVTDASDEANLIESWRFSEGVEIGTGPEVVFGEKGILDLEYSGTAPTWVASREGDDPDLFAGSPVGQRKEMSFGPAQNIPLVNIDSQRHLHSWQNTDIPDIDRETDPHRLRQNGVPMVREISHTHPDAGGWVFDAATSTVTYAIPSHAPLFFGAFIPSQAEPARLGQRVRFTNTVSNNKTFRVAAVSEDGKTMTLADETVTDESAPAGATVESHPSDTQWRSKPADWGTPRYLETFSTPSGDLTADLRLADDAPPFGRWTTLHEAISGKSVQTPAVSFDPTLALYVPVGSNRTIKDVLDELARAAFGWWIENPDFGGGQGEHLLGTWTPPSGTPVADLGPAHLREVEPLRTVLPVRQFNIAHTPIWKTQGGDALAGSVSQADRLRWGRDRTIETVVDRAVAADYPESREIPELRTLITPGTYDVTQTVEDLAQFRTLAKAFLQVRRRWFRLIFHNLWGLFIRPNDVVTVTWDDPGLTLSNTLCRVTGREIDPVSGTLELEVFT